MKHVIGLCTLLVCIFFTPALGARANVLELPPVVSEVEVPIIMYHLVTERDKYIGKYGIRPAALEADLQYLAAQGYTTVLMADVIAFVQNGTALPAKPIVLTFDDGNTGDILYVLPLLEKYDARAVVSIIGEATDKYTKEQAEKPGYKFPNMTWDEVRTLHESGRVEIQSHGYDMHGKLGAGIRGGEGAEAYHARLKADLEKLQERIIAEVGFVPTTFTYPLGVISKGAQAVLEEVGFAASLSCQEGMNVLTVGDEVKLFNLMRSNRPANKNIGALLEAMPR